MRCDAMRWSFFYWLAGWMGSVRFEQVCLLWSDRAGSSGERGGLSALVELVLGRFD